MRIRTILTLILLSLLGAVTLSTPAAIDFEEQFGLPLLFAARGQQDAPRGVTILAIDEATVDWLRRSSANLETAEPRLSECISDQGAQTLGSAKSVTDLPRDFYACLISSLKAFEPSLIVMDVNFSLPKDADVQLAAEMRDAGTVILVEGIKTVFDRNGELAAIVRERPSKILLDEALDSGGFHVGTGSNRMTTWYLGEFRPFVDIDPLPVVAARRTGAAETEAETFQRLWFYGPPGSMQRVTARRLLRGSSSGVVEKGAIIFVGYDTRGLSGARDHFPVPMTSLAEDRMSGVEIAATAYLNLRDGHVLREPADALLFAVKFLITLIFIGFALGRPLRRKIYLIVGIASIMIGATIMLFFNLYYVAIILTVLASSSLAIGLLLLRRLYLAQASTRALAPAQIANQLMDGSEYSESTGNASVLFLDLVGSTSLAQSLSSVEYAKAIRAYYGIVGDQVENAGGLLLEFRGDGILAAFQKETIGRGYASAACKTVRKIKMAIDDRAEAEQMVSQIHVRCGLATGEVTLSSAAAGERVVLTMVGDTVNAAARIEQLGKELHSKSSEKSHVVCLVDDATRIESHLPEETFLFHGVERLRGRSTKTDLYQLMMD